MGDVHQRARRGIRLLVARQAVLHLFAITAGVFIARVLDPGPIGLFGIALFVVTLLGLAADLGMGTALIQQATPPTERQLRTCFTLQHGLTTLLVAAVYLAAPALATVSATAAGALALLLPLEPGTRGLTTAAIIFVVFTAAVWWTGPRWLRSLVLEEIAAPALWLRRSATP